MLLVLLGQGEGFGTMRMKAANRAERSSHLQTDFIYAEGNQEAKRRTCAVDEACACVSKVDEDFLTADPPPFKIPLWSSTTRIAMSSTTRARLQPAAFTVRRGWAGVSRTQGSTIRSWVLQRRTMT